MPQAMKAKALSEKEYKPRPGRPEMNPADPLQIVTVSLPASLRKRVQVAADASGHSMASLVRKALEKHLSTKG